MHEFDDFPPSAATLRQFLAHSDLVRFMPDQMLANPDAMR